MLICSNITRQGASRLIVTRLRVLPPGDWNLHTLYCCWYKSCNIYSKVREHSNNNNY